MGEKKMENDIDQIINNLEMLINTDAITKSTLIYVVRNAINYIQELEAENKKYREIEVIEVDGKEYEEEEAKEIKAKIKLKELRTVVELGADYGEGNSKEAITTTHYIDGKAVKSVTEYKY